MHGGGVFVFSTFLPFVVLKIYHQVSTERMEDNGIWHVILAILYDREPRQRAKVKLMNRGFICKDRRTHENNNGLVFACDGLGLCI